MATESHRHLVRLRMPAAEAALKRAGAGVSGGPARVARLASVGGGQPGRHPRRGGRLRITRVVFRGGAALLGQHGLQTSRTQARPARGYVESSKLVAYFAAE